MVTQRRGKAPLGSLAREPLSYALGTRARVACLRLLSLTPGPLTQRELARRAGLQHRTSQLALDELVALGLVNRLQGGRDMLVSLNHDHYLAGIAKLFLAESEFFLALRSDLVEAAIGAPRTARASSVVLFGSVARSDDRPGSDIDVLVITRTAADIAVVLSRLNDAGDRLRRRYGYALRPIAYALADARRRWRRRAQPLEGVMRDHVVLAGPPLRELLDG